MVDRNLLKDRRAALRGGAAGLSIAAALMAITSVPAFAQTEPAEQPEATEEGTIIVTGSLIENPNLERSSPVNVTTADVIELKQSNTAEEVLRELPGVVPSLGSAVNNGSVGASFVDLRGLGPARNIVLLDGVRLTPASLLGPVDLNNIPLALIERVDALTGAASTTYGADAITGVVNFITKRDFAGVELAASQQITERGDGNTLRIDATIGASFDDGRGNAVLSIGYQEADVVFQGDRDFAVTAIDSFSGGSGGSSTTVPAAFSFSGGGVGADRLTGNRQIDPALGFAVRQQRDAAGAPLPGVAGVYAPYNFNPLNIFQTPFERFNLYGAGRYEISDTIEVYTRALFSKNLVTTLQAPSGAFGVTVNIPVSNPFLPVGLRNQFCANNDFDSNTAGIQTLTPAQCTAAAAATNPNDPNYRTFATNLRRRSVEVGPRQFNFQTTVFDYRIGARGKISDSVNWDVFGAYGESENIQTIKNYVLISRLRDALLATNPTTCLSGTSGCMPVNIFGAQGSILPAQIPYLTGSSTSTNRASLAQGRATISGDFGISSPLAAEPIGFALGGEYRKYTAEQSSDLLAQTPGELGGFGGANANILGGYDVYEAFGEIVAPLIEDRPFMKSLTLEGGLRYSSYKIDTPGAPGFNTTTFKIGGSWEPGAGLKFRANYSRAVRAPNIGELFSPLVVGLTNLSLDPCQAVYPGPTSAGTPNPNLSNADFRAICRAQGAPLSALFSIGEPTSGQSNASGTGSTSLKPEKANTYTFGAVFQPDFIPGLSISADYYNIRVTNAITAALPGDAIAACFGLPTNGVYTSVTAANASRSACTVIGRDPSTGELNSDPATTTGLYLPLTNFGKLETDGIDLAINYRRDIGSAKLTLGFFGNYTFHSKFQAIAVPSAQYPVVSLDRECVGYYSVNCSFTGSIQPKFQWSQRTTLSFENGIDVSLLWRHVDGVQQEPEDILNGNGPGFQGTLPGFGKVDFQKVKSYDYFDLTTRFAVVDALTVTLTVQNLMDKQPPLLGTSIGSTSFNSGNTYPSTYDALGRRFAVGVKLKF